MTSPPPLHLDVSWVGDLIDHDLGAWKTDTVKRLFFPHESDLIASITLSSHLPDDKMVWALTSNGKFSVRSTYHLAMEMAVKVEKVQAPLGVVEAEAKAVEFGLHLARDMMIQEFVLESDSLSLINALKETSPPFSSIAAVVYGLLSDSHNFRHVDFSHVRQQANKPAHLLAKYALGIDDFSVWLEESPCFLEQALLNDVLLICSVQ